MSLTAVLLLLFAAFLAVRKGYARHAWLKRHEAALKTFLLLAMPAFAVSVAGAEGLKLLFQIPRPCLPCPGADCSIFCPPTFSFPSSHASGTVALAAAMFLWGGMKKKYLAAFAFPALVGASRVVLGVHTVFDVSAGFTLGLIVTFLAWRHRKAITKWEERAVKRL